MGWFDESDSEHDEPTPQQNSVPQQNTEEEEDPLDAYMKSLEESAPQATTTQKKRAERLDVAGEEEATSHWQETTKKKSIVEQEHDVDRDSIIKQEMASMFHKAGKQRNEDDEDEEKKSNKQVTLTLEQVQHDSIHYNDFEKCFWTTTDTKQGRDWRRQHDVSCTEAIDPILSLHELKDVFGDALLQHVYNRNFTKPTLVQSQTLPIALTGKDAIVTAATGSGKTLAYVWPMVVHCCDQPHLTQDESGPIGIVLVPTRELALQVHKHAKSMLSPLGGTCVAVTGGTSRYQLVQDLHKSGGCEVIVATPGRFLDVLSVKKNGVSLKRVTFVVLDEADKLLDMGFESQVSQILKNIRPNRQSLLLSATMGRKVERVAQKWLLPHPVRIAIGRTGESSRHVTQHVMVLPSYEAKKKWIMEMIPTLASVGRTLVFVATRADCETLVAELRETNPNVTMETLHGDKHQTDRNKALRAFSKGEVSVLIATDLAARGLDVAQISTVVNFDIAKNLDAHVHRIGRAGRLSKTEHRQGTAYTLLVTPKHADFAHVLVNAFEREGRQIDPQLQALADKSRRSGNVASRNRHNQAGLGFSSRDASFESSSETNGGLHGSNYYGPATSEQSPPTKRGRWS